MYALKRWTWLVVVVGCLTATSIALGEPTTAPAQTSQAKTQQPTKVSEQIAQRSDGRVQANWLGQVFSFGMLPLWVCSILLVALIFERSKALRTENIIDAAMIEQIAALVGQGKIAEAQKVAEGSASVLGKAWANAFNEFRLGGAPLAEVLTSSTLLALKPLKKNLQAMGTIGVISPSFGLLGTVVGMIMVFSQIELTGGADKGELAGGIGLALFTTAGGLIVAIPAILTSRYFKARLIALADQAEEAISRVNYRHVHAQAAGKVNSADDALQGDHHEGTD